MKKVILLLMFGISCMCSYGQLQGSFGYGQDGHIYFYLSNPTAYQIPVTWGVYNFRKNEQRLNQGVMTPYSTFTYGPNASWLWEKGERFAVTYANGQTEYWTCPESDSALRNRSNPSFKGYSGACSYKDPKTGKECTCTGESERQPSGQCSICKHSRAKYHRWK